jgi:phosphatidylinositol phospholipase C delta
MSERTKQTKKSDKMSSKPKKQTYSVCFCCRRRFKLGVSEAPPEIKELFHRYCDENGIMTASHLKRFLIEVQKEDNITDEQLQAIIDSQKHLSIFHRRGFNLETFFKFLFSDSNPPLVPSRGVINNIPFFICSLIFSD